MLPLCSYVGPRGGRCKRPAVQEGDRCLSHLIEDEEAASQADELINTVLENPAVKKGVDKVNSLLDRFSAVIEQAAKGEIPFFKPKPAPTPQKGDPVLKARALMHFSSDEPLTEEIIKTRRKVLARLAHPDATANGSNEAMIKINRATEILLSSISSKSPK